MITTEIPKRYEASPSSYTGTPRLTINHGAAVDADSSNAFEGPEKLLEVWFNPSASPLPPSAAPAGLKAVPASAWQEMLELVNCKVLSVVESEHVDAYLLSESSMFVFPHKLILKTCGTTTLLNGLPRILEIAATLAGFPRTDTSVELSELVAALPYRVFYSRKKFLFPDRQRGPHRSWRDEVKTLDRLFHGGSAYVIGKLNGEHWYLYLTEPNTMLTPPLTPEEIPNPTTSPQPQDSSIYIPSIASARIIGSEEETSDSDETLEILMTDLDPDNAKQFYLNHASGVAEGRYFARAHEARLDAERHLGSLESVPAINSNGSTPAAAAKSDREGEDIFSSTSSDPCDLTAAEDYRTQMPTFPDDLTTEGHGLGTVVSETSGLSDLYPTSKYPDARIDAYLFTPCGFSANGVVPAPKTSPLSQHSMTDSTSSIACPTASSTATHYFTVHVTPEPHCSYASFETNVPHQQSGRETADVITQVVQIFKPGKFSVTLFETNESDTANTDDVASDENRSTAQNGHSSIETDLTTAASIKASARTGTKKLKKDAKWDKIPGYRRVDRIVHDLDGYDLIFKHFEKVDKPVVASNGASQSLSP